MRSKSHVLFALRAFAILAQSEDVSSQPRRDYFYVGGEYRNVTVSMNVGQPALY